MARGLLNDHEANDMQRRLFISSILAAAAAPAIVRAESMMKIVVPKARPIFLGMDFGSGDFTIEGWIDLRITPRQIGGMPAFNALYRRRSRLLGLQ